MAQLIIMDAKWWLQEPKAAEHIPLVVREQREINVTTQVTFLFSQQLE